MMGHVEFKVVGMTFLHELSYGADYPADFERLREYHEASQHDSLDWDGTGVEAAPVAVHLYRNPDNPHDANAIEVHVPKLGRRSMIGHVPRDVAARLAPLIDQGETWEASLVAVLIEPEHPDRPGALIAVERNTTTNSRQQDNR